MQLYHGAWKTKVTSGFLYCSTEQREKMLKQNEQLSTNVQNDHWLKEASVWWKWQDIRCHQSERTFPSLFISLCSVRYYSTSSCETQKCGTSHSCLLWYPCKVSRLTGTQCSWLCWIGLPRSTRAWKIYICQRSEIPIGLHSFTARSQ